MYITIKHITMHFKVTTRTEYKMKIYLITGYQAVSFALRKKKQHTNELKKNSKDWYNNATIQIHKQVAASARGL